MSNKEFHTKEDQSLLAAKLGELMELCVNLNGEHFTCFLEYSGHVNNWKIHTNNDGYSTNKESNVYKDFYVRPDFSSAARSIETVNGMIDKLNKLKLESDGRWSEENQAAQKAKIKERRIKLAREKLAKLESE